MNRATTKGIKRIRQSAWCCGQNYQRWRFRGKSEYPPGHTHCCICHQPLVFKNVTKPTLDRYYRQREKNLNAGLTCFGKKPRRANFNIPTPTDKAWRNARAGMEVPDQSWDQAGLTPLARAGES